MFMYIFSVVLIIAANIFYNICQKATPQKANPFIALFATYAIASIVTLILFHFSKTDKGFLESIKDLNWTSIVLAFCIVGLEFGYIMAYRSGWSISVCPLVANSVLAILLIPIGIFIFKENFELNKLFGIIFCIIGLILINRN